MPDPTAAAPDASQVLSDQYDHGDASEPALATSPSPSPPAETAATPTQPRNPDGTYAKPAPLTSEALRLGLTEGEVAAATASELREHVALLQRIEHGRLLRSVLDRAEKPAAAAKAPEPAAVPDEFDLDSDEFDPKLRAMSKALKTALAKIDQLERRDHERETHAFLNRLDTLFTADDATFGKGATDALGADSPELARRQAVMMHLNNIPREKRTTLEKDVARIRAALFGKVTPAPTPEPAPAPKAPDWYEAGLSRPSGRTAPPEPKGAARAAKAIAPILAQMNGAAQDPDMPD